MDFLGKILPFVIVPTITIVIGLLVFLRNPKSRLHKVFFILAITIAFWMLSSSVSDTTRDYELSKISSNLAFGFGYLAVLMGYVYAFAMRPNPNDFKKRRSFFILIGLIGGILFSTPLVYNLTTIDTYENGPLYFVYLITLPILLFFCSREFFHHIKNGNPQQKAQTKLIVYGFGASVLVAITFNVLIPAITQTLWTTKLGTSFSIIFVISVAIAITRHKLFDIRLIVARSLAYGLALITIAGVYSSIIFGISARYLNAQELNVWQNIFNIFAGILLALTFQPLKKQFDKLTNKLFYRDAYETQDLISEFNKTAVSTIDLEQLLIKVSEIIDKYIKSEYCEFGIRMGEHDTVRVIGLEDAKASKETLEQLRAYSKTYPKKVIVTDDLESENNDLKTLLDKAKIGMLARITSDKAVEGVGYLILGYRKSGNPYTSQDRKAVDIITNGLVIAIQNALAFEEIQKFNITLQKKVDDATKQLRKTNEKLRILDQTKDEFISMASHQLRTPLTSVKGYVSMVLEGDAGKLGEQQRKLLNQAFVSSQRMVFLIADLLNVSRLKTGKFVIENKLTNLADVVQGEIEQLKETAKSRNLTFTYNKPKKFPDLMLDETKIRQVIMNFADNAIHYTSAGGKIDINLREAPESIEYTVTDTGLGVPKSEQHHMFTKFYRAKNAKKARPDGTGLGLFMAKKVIVAQGGSVIFKSQEGKGSTFGFTFPKKKLSPPEITPDK